MIHHDITAHLEQIAETAFPEAEVTIRCFGGEATYDRNKGRSIIASETMKAEVFVSSNEALDHLALIRKLGQTEVTIGGMKMFRTYRRHSVYDYAEVNELKRISFQVEFLYDIGGE